MHMNKPSVTKIQAADSVGLLQICAIMVVIKKTVAFRYRN